MNQIISQTWNWFFRFLLNRITLVLTLLFCVAMGLALSNMSRLSSNLLESQAIQNAALYIQTFDQSINLYSDAAADRARMIEGVEVTHAYLSQPGGIPLPSTFAIELGERVSNLERDLIVRFYSDYPFPWRQDTGGPRMNLSRMPWNFCAAIRVVPSHAWKRTMGGRLCATGKPAS
ncbi:hypothetical protein [Egbenema bharatensis]|uniref:hypothetical protein n=1 Tax=Egbenema bharatensis TaxID=3463334 RepID=UPI003A85DACD